MCDFFNDDDFEDTDSFEDSLEGKMDETFTGGAEPDDESVEAESEDDALTVDPFILGGAMGFAYEQGLRERKRKKRKKSSDDSD